MRTTWLVLVLGACSRGLPAAAPENLALVERNPVPAPPSVGFSVVPAELGDDGAIERMRHRVRVRWFRFAAARPDAPMEVTHVRAAREVDRIVHVIAETAKQLRVVVQADRARLAMWIDRGDAWQTAITPIQLGERDGRVVHDRGVVLDAGAPIDVAFGRGETRHVTLRDEDVVVDGWAPASALGHVWVGSDPLELDDSEMTSSYAPPDDDRRPRAWLAKSAKLHLAPGGPVFGAIAGEQVVGFVIARGAWTLVEIPRPFARIRGYVEARHVLPATEQGLGFTGGGGGGFVMTHTDRIAIPAGTCIYDREDGEVVGVQIEDSERYGNRGDDGWHRVYVWTPWAVLPFFVHDTGRDPKQPALESCRPR